MPSVILCRSRTTRRPCSLLVGLTLRVGYLYEKAELAKKLFDQRKLKTDISERLVWLNELRKDVSYGEPGVELATVALEALVSDLEHFLQEVDDLITGIEEG